MITDINVRENDNNIFNSLVLTEKSLILRDNGNNYVFSCKIGYNKNEIRGLLKRYFGVDIIKIRTLNRKGKVKKFRGIKGVKSSKKIVYVKFADKVNLGS